jgi:hypothetical protein
MTVGSGFTSLAYFPGLDHAWKVGRGRHGGPAMDVDEGVDETNYEEWLAERGESA